MPAPVVTPAGPLALRGNAVQHFTANEEVEWVAGNGGTLSDEFGDATDWTAPNITGSYVVEANNGFLTFVTIVVTGVFLWMPSYTYPVKRKKQVLKFTPESGPSQEITKRGKKLTFEIGANTRTKVEHTAVEAFWDAHFPNKQFYFTHPGTGVEGIYKIDSDMNEEWSRVNLNAWSMVLQEV